MKKNFSLITFLAFVLFSASAQKSQVLLEHYQNEYQSFKEMIKYSQIVKGDTNIDVKFYYIDITIGVPDPYISGDVTIRFEPVSSNLTAVMFSLNSSLTVDAISAPCESFYQDNDVIMINLDDVYNPGDLIDLTISYQGTPVMAGGYKGMRYESHNGGEPIIATLSTPYLAHYWYPCKDGPQDKPDSVYMDITLPKISFSGVEIMGVSNGVLENIIDNGDSNTFQWRHRYPIVTYYVMAAVSNYVHFQEEFNGTGGESFPLDYYVFEEHFNQAQSGVADLPEVIQFYSDVFGTYPFSNEKYGMTQLGFYGAIENQTNTIQNNLSASWFYTSIHELGHMWFGDMITLADWHHCWLNEGFATYSEALWDEHKYGFEAYKNNMATNEFWNGGTLYLQNAADTFNTFQSIFYSKGAYTVHMLRGVLGDDAFFEALMDYAQNPNFKYKNASTEDLKQSFENSSGLNLDYFFEQWVYDAYWPQYAYNFAQNTNLDVNLLIKQQQEELYGYRPVFTMPVQVRFDFTDNSDTTVTIWNDQQEQTFWFEFGKTVESVELDPDKWILRKAFFQPQLPVSIIETETGPAISCFPNPFYNEIKIEFRRADEIAKRLSVIDFSGRIVFMQEIKNNNEKANIFFWNGLDNDGQKMQAGSYLIEITTDLGVYTQMIIKTN
ncbi:MAG: T9SS type A sorting domain-containing protein [Bacteroidales bacterium]|nr:T9SS type A sorting domain-containing protein [Bacteroidales bacterium]